MTSTRDAVLLLSFRPAPDYCRYFADHAATWTLHLSDEVLTGLRACGLKCDERMPINCPAGLTRHELRLPTAK